MWQRFAAPRRWPLALKVPLLVAALVIAAAVTLSQMVLVRLAETQATHFRQLTGGYLDGLSTALHPHVIRRDPWETFDVLDRAKGKYSGVKAVSLLVVLPDETVLASSTPQRFAIMSAAPAESRPPAPGSPPDLDAESAHVWVHRALAEGGVPVGRIAGEIDVAALQAVRAETLWTLVAFNTALTAVFVVFGWLLVRRMLSPLARLSQRLADAGDGRLAQIPENDLPPADSEVGRAYRHYNAAAAAVAEREALLQRLTDEERKALVGRFASAVAHEVNNPLGGLFNAVRMIQRHGEDPVQRERAALLLERGLTGIHNVVRAQLMVWRGEADPRDVAAADVEDLRFLIESEARRRELRLDWQCDLRSPAHAPARVPAQVVRQIALNLLLNACSASPPGGTVAFRIAARAAGLALSVADQGGGLPDEARRLLTEEPPSRLPAASTSPAAGGLGLWTVARLVAERRGNIRVEGPPGTVIQVQLPLAEPLAVAEHQPANVADTDPSERGESVEGNLSAERSDSTERSASDRRIAA